MLTEVAPGLDVERDVLRRWISALVFRLSSESWIERLFREARMGLQLADRPVDETRVMTLVIPIGNASRECCSSR